MPYTYWQNRNNGQLHQTLVGMDLPEEVYDELPEWEFEALIPPDPPEFAHFDKIMPRYILAKNFVV